MCLSFKGSAYRDDGQMQEAGKQVRSANSTDNASLWTHSFKVQKCFVLFLMLGQFLIVQMAWDKWP